MCGEATRPTIVYAITAIDVNPPSLGSTTFANDVRYVRCDVLDASSLSNVFSEARPAVVVHTVGVYPLGTKRYSMKGKDAIFKINVEGTKNVMAASKEHGAKGFVYTSSVTVVLDELDQDFRNVDERWPTKRANTSYGLSKAIAEDIVLAASTHEFATCALRSAPIFGPNDAVCIPTIHSCIAAGQTPFVLGTGRNLQDFVHVNNVAYAHVLAVGNLLNSQTAAGEAMFITNGEPVTARDMCLGIWREFGHVPKFQVTVPESLAWWLGYCAEWVDCVTGAESLLSRGIRSSPKSGQSVQPIRTVVM
ncbi:eukaryotic translation initiation factor 3 subunit b [Stemphylium lycopersici]|uniref:C-3 sterol dehydrogenase/C-4 decarboxylase-like protein n=1 Tax=Stemphylium lycopersici TaxID=183478 RepID=A0A364MU18_STELY|nr:eukaryotic translation initiation factor 3 subunit b [Stemphylium lycopersici]RAR03107.1 C-3 sterol dehydrogenase/C-4 decarboxylase-like protein [Stemphylium lycopersici]